MGRLADVDFVAVIGPSAAGKTTLIRAAIHRDPSLHLVLNNTSRARRPDEHDGVDFRFETRAKMEERIVRREYAQVAPTAFGDLYATAAADYATTGVSLLPVLAAAMPMFRSLPFRSVRTIYVLPPDLETWRQRLESRQFDSGKMAQRLAEAKQSLTFAVTDPDTRFVVNDDLATATDQFIALARTPMTANLPGHDDKHAPQLAQHLLTSMRPVITSERCYPNSR